jgi:class 3 adenylate cyclase
MLTREIPRHEWQSYFEDVTRQLTVMTVDVEVSSATMGSQPELTAVQLRGLSYDPHDDAFSILAGSVEHRITAPTEIFVEEEPRGLLSIQVIDGEGRQHLARFTRALPLPSPGRATP